MPNEFGKKAAAKLLRDAFAKKGVTLPQNEALDLVATLKGYQSWAHMQKMTRPCKASAIPAKRMLTLQQVLQDYYEPKGECPAHPLADWNFQTENGDTKLGYWEWLPGEALLRDDTDLLDEAYELSRPAKVTLPNGVESTWDIEENLTDRCGDLNSAFMQAKPGLAILALEPALAASLIAELVDEICFVVRKDGEFGILAEVEYCSRESECVMDNSDAALKPHAEVKAALLKGLRGLQERFPSVEFCVPAVQHIVNDRPAVWAYFKPGTLSAESRDELSSALLSI